MRDGAVGGMRAAFLTNSPAPYRDQLFRRLAERFASVHVYYSEPSGADRGWSIDEGCATTRLRSVVGLGRAGALQPGVFEAVRTADVIFVGGYETATYILAMVAGRVTRRRVVLFFDGIAPSRFSNRGVKLWLKRLLVRIPHVCLVNGTVGRRYFQDILGVPSERLLNQYLLPVPAADVPPSAISPDVLFVGRLVERKGVGEILEAVRLAPELSVLIVGDGPMRNALELRAAGLNVRFAGELHGSAVCAVMRAARCLVVPSRDEPWGLVVHEAIQCNLPVVVSSDVGSALDLVVDGVNGIVVPLGDPLSLLEAARQAMHLDAEVLARVNARLRDVWTIEAYVSAFVQAAVAGPSKRPWVRRGRC